MTAQKLDIPPSATAATANTISNTESNNNLQQQQQQQQRNEAKRKRHDYVHAMISNRHCRIFCLLNIPDKNNRSMAPPEMEVFVEDTSGNGTLVNGTTLLRKNERRKLHTGDVICMLNPKLLAKKLRSTVERKLYMSQYSYVFVNLYEQEARYNSSGLCWGSQSSSGGCGNTNTTARSRGRGGEGGGGSKSNTAVMSTAKKSAVNVRATKCHSIQNNGKSKRSLFSNGTTGMAGGGGGGGMGGGEDVPCQQLRNPQTQHHQQQSNRNGKSSLGSFLHNTNLQSSSASANNPNNHSSNNNGNTNATIARTNTIGRRRIEEEYDLRDLLGTGTCGEVRRAIHRRTGEERAVKIISIGGRGGAAASKAAGGGGGGMSSEKLSAIQAEAEILRSLDHPYVVKLFDMYISPGRAIYLVMELIRGGDLFDRIVERERYTEVQARQLFRRILTAVHYLHEECGIVHRDLKPENILVVDKRSDVNIKLTDFGLAKNMTAEGLKTFCGTPQYFAPEVLRRSGTIKGNGRYGKEIDCWSIGVILFILLSGSPPFDVSAGFDAVANAKVAFYEDQWRHVSREARDLVMRLLQKDPRKRMSVKDACKHPWVLVKDGDTHTHPLRDPVVGRSSGITSESSPGIADAEACVDTTSGKSDSGSASNESKDSAGATAEQQLPAAAPTKPPSSNASAKHAKPPSSSWRKACGPVDANTLSPISMHNQNNNVGKFQSLSAPQPSKDGRQPSLWPVPGNEKTVTKAIQQSCHTTRPSPNGSPIKKRQLFDEPPAPKKMTKQDYESIKSAGSTLPKPVINEESLLIKKVPAQKKKVQSTLFAASELVKQQQQQQVNNAKPAASLPEKAAVGTDNKRKAARTPTVTPPSDGQNLVFRLNKKHKIGAHQDGESKAAATAKEPSAPVKKSELSEDELQSDFSDDEEGATMPAVATNIKSPTKSSEKKPLDKFLHKRKMDSIESTASADFGSKPRLHNQNQQQERTTQKHVQQEVEMPRPVSKDSCGDEAKRQPSDTAVGANKKANTAASKGKDRKKIQSLLFGISPPNNGELQNERNTSDSTASNNDDGSTIVNDGLTKSNLMQTDNEEGNELRRQSSSDSANCNGNTTATAPPVKGKQRSIKSWFQPKKS